jgi:hypothetical protein
MVYSAVNQALDFGEVAYHAVVVQFFGTAVHIHFPVVTMQVLALALIVEVELMARGYFQGFSEVIHISVGSYQLFSCLVILPDGK